jgi:SAM-dependent methyltransferase
MDKEASARMGSQEDTHWWFVARRQIVKRLISKYCALSSESKILEAGCGTGGNLELLNAFGTLDAFEFDEINRGMAQEKSGMKIPFGALPDEVPFKDKKYNLIALLDVLEHIELDEASLTALGQKLETRGRILVTVPAMPWLWSKHDVVHHHFRRYTHKSLCATAEAAGLKVVKASYFNFLLFPLVVIKRLADKLTSSDSPDDETPSSWLNTLLFHVFRIEKHIVGSIPMPWGLSLFVILER